MKHAHPTARIRLLTPAEHAGDSQRHSDATLTIGNDEELPPLAEHIARAARIDLAFPSFTDGRAYSQAYLLRKRYDFAGDPSQQVEWSTCGSWASARSPGPRSAAARMVPTRLDRRGTRSAGRSASIPPTGVSRPRSAGVPTWRRGRS